MCELCRFYGIPMAMHHLTVQGYRQKMEEYLLRDMQNLLLTF